MDGSKVLSLPDRILGGVLGLFKGLIVIAIIMFPLSLFEDSYKKVTQGSTLAPYFEKIVHIVKQGSYDSNLMNKIQKFSASDVKNRVKQMGDLKKFTQEMNAKKDDLLKSVQDLVENEKSQEDYTDEDKNKLNDLLNTFLKE